MTAISTPPASSVRRMDFSFDDSQKFWFAGDPFMSHFMNNLSSLFPSMARSSRRQQVIRDQVTEPQLKKDISAFIGQKPCIQEHAAYNDYAAEHNIDLELLELRIKVLRVRPRSLKKQRLAATCVSGALHRNHGRTTAAARRPDHPDE